MKTHALAMLTFAVMLRADDLTGTWSGVMDSQPLRFELRQNGARVAGVMIYHDFVTPLQAGEVQRNSVTFRVEDERNIHRFELQAAGSRLGGTVRFNERGKESSEGSVLVTRVPPGEPGAFTGQWIGAVDLSETKIGAEPATLVLRQRGQGLEGYWADGADEDHAISGGKVTAGLASFDFEFGGLDWSKEHVELRAAGGGLAGKVKVSQDPKTWTVPLQLKRDAKGTGASGRWVGALEQKKNGEPPLAILTFRLRQDGSSLSGRFLEARGRSKEISAGAMRGDKITFAIADYGVRVELTVAGDEASGRWIDGEGKSMSFMMVRRLE